MPQSVAIQKLQAPPNNAGNAERSSLFPAGLTADRQFQDRVRDNASLETVPADKRWQWVLLWTRIDELLAKASNGSRRLPICNLLVTYSIRPRVAMKTRRECTSSVRLVRPRGRPQLREFATYIWVLPTG